MMKFKILEIEASMTYLLRHQLLRKGKPYNSCFFDHDEAKETIHLGAFHSKKLIGILSAFQKTFPQNNDLKAVQLRAIAVEPTFQRKGIASMLIQHALKKIRLIQSPDCFWLNARVQANTLYLENGFTPIGEPFEIKSIGKHQRFIKYLYNDK